MTADGPLITYIRVSGAPKANQNARTYDLSTRDAIAERRRIEALLGEARKLLDSARGG